MFNVVHQGRKYVPSVTDESPGTMNEASKTAWSHPGAKLRISKAGKGAAIVKAVRPHLSPLPAAWSERAHGEVKPPVSSPSHEGRNEMDGHGAGPPRARKRGFRPPDVRTIFTPGEKDPRVRQESGEGHTFLPGGKDTWCDMCCLYIFQHGVTCAGCKYACHAACRDRVSLDCHPAASPASQDQINNNTPPH
ncbi:ras association domain-containing protein 5, partial [Cebidichthys violaceus]|uniref:ras association domain-containing protein 5 n=1 Tax=Cebidichthys violaceus TaxID=271503 RepID=UPI0035CC3C63